MICRYGRKVNSKEAKAKRERVQMHTEQKGNGNERTNERTNERSRRLLLLLLLLGWCRCCCCCCAVLCCAAVLCLYCTATASTKDKTRMFFSLVRVTSRLFIRTGEPTSRASESSLLLLGSLSNPVQGFGLIARNRRISPSLGLFFLHECPVIVPVFAL